MLLTKRVMIKWNPANIKWYESKDYIFTKWKDEFEVKVEDLSDGSGASVEVQCDGCDEILTIKWNDYKRYIDKDNKYYCRNCNNKSLINIETRSKTKLKNSKTFKEWCIKNLPKKISNTILSLWDCELNIDKNGNTLTPENVSYSSHGIDGQGYWFKCLYNSEHKSELKSIVNFTSKTGSRNIECTQCNVISITHPHLIKFLKNKEDASKFSYGSNENIPMMCPDCGYEKKSTFHILTNNGFSCPMCSDGKSYPEKFILYLLVQLQSNPLSQLSKKTFNWCEKYKYDNYIENINCIVETHGKQHYEEVGRWGSLEIIQENDFDKEWLARQNKVDNYIILNCRKSEIDWIKRSVMDSKLPQLLNFKEEDIDWLKCHEFACSSLVKLACDEWNKGIENTLKIAVKLGTTISTIIKYLKQGVKLGLCNYDPKFEKFKVATLMQEKNRKKVICLTTGEIFDSLVEASTKYNIADGGLSNCCNDKTKSAGKHSITGEKLVWMFYEDYTNYN